MNALIREDAWNRASQNVNRWENNSRFLFCHLACQTWEITVTLRHIKKKNGTKTSKSFKAAHEAAVNLSSATAWSHVEEHLWTHNKRQDEPTTFTAFICRHKFLNRSHIQQVENTALLNGYQMLRMEVVAPWGRMVTDLNPQTQEEKPCHYPLSFCHRVLSQSASQNESDND